MTSPGAPPSSTPSVGDPIKASLIQQIVQALTAADSGLTAITPTAANTPTSGAVTFDSGRFAIQPVVQATAVTSAPGSVVTGVAVTSITPTGCIVWVTRTNTVSTVVEWLAVLTP